MTVPVTFTDAHRAAMQNPGVTLFTVSIVTADGQHVTRAYTSHEEVYPAGGLKPVLADSVEADTTFTRNRAEVIANFSEHELILSLDCTAAINVTLRADGEVIGAVNFLHSEDVYTPDSVPVAEAIAESLRPAITAFRIAQS